MRKGSLLINDQLKLLDSLTFFSFQPPSSTQKTQTMVLLVTSDNEQFHADKDVVERSVLIKNMLEGQYPSCLSCNQDANRVSDVGESDQPIPLPNVSSSVLKKVYISRCAIA
jgi:hypothetical protein